MVMMVTETMIMSCLLLVHNGDNSSRGGWFTDPHVQQANESRIMVNRGGDNNKPWAGDHAVSNQSEWQGSKEWSNSA